MSILRSGPDPYGKDVVMLPNASTISANTELFSFITVTGTPAESLGVKVPSPA